MINDITNATNAAGSLKAAELRRLIRFRGQPQNDTIPSQDLTGLSHRIGSTETRRNGELGLRTGRDALALFRPRGKNLTSDNVVKVRHFLE